MEQPKSTREKTWIFALTSAGSLMMALDAMVVASALNTIRTDFHASIEALGWTMNAYTLSFAVLLLSGAALGDRFGRRRMFVAGLGLFVIASAACALAPSIGWLIGARIVQGAGAALVTPLALALLSAAFAPHERAKILGLYASVNGLALILGPTLGGIIVEGAAWQWIFWINIPIGLVLIPLVQRHIPESKGPAGAFDVVGVTLVATASLGLVWALMDGNALGWSDPRILAALAAGALLTIAFIAWERRATAPMVPLRLFRIPAFSAANGAGFLLGAALFSALFFLPQFLQSTLGFGPLGGGLRLLAWTATLFVVAPISGRLVNRYGERPLIVLGLTLQAIGLSWIGAIATPDMPYIDLIAPLILSGAGVSMAMPAAQNAVLNSVSGPEIGKASGLYNMFRFLGSVSGIAIASAVFAHNGSPATAATFTSGFNAALEAAAVISLLGALAGLGVPARATKAALPAGETLAVKS